MWTTLWLGIQSYGFVIGVAAFLSHHTFHQLVTGHNNNCYTGLWRIKQGHKIKGNCQLHNINVRKNLDSFISFTRCNVLRRPTQSHGSVRMGWMPIISDLGLLLLLLIMLSQLFASHHLYWHSLLYYSRLCLLPTILSICQIANASSDLAGAPIAELLWLASSNWARPNWMLSSRPKPSSQKICPQAAFGGNHHTFYVIDSTFSRWEWTYIRRDQRVCDGFAVCLFTFLVLDSQGLIWDFVHCDHGCNKSWRPVGRSTNKVLRLFFLKNPNRTCYMLAFCIRLLTMASIGILANSISDGCRTVVL